MNTISHCGTAMFSTGLTRLNDPMPILMPPLKWICVFFCCSVTFVAFAKAWQSLVRKKTTHFAKFFKHDNVLFLFFFVHFLSLCWQHQQKPPQIFLLVDLITVSDPHPALDEADNALIQEGESCFLQKNFGIAQFCMHLLCQEKHHHVKYCWKQIGSANVFLGIFNMPSPNVSWDPAAPCNPDSEQQKLNEWSF